VRRAFINTQALREHLGSLRGAHETLDLRANAYGLGLAKTSEIAAEVGFARVVASPGDSEASVLPIDPVSETALTNWWDSPEALVTFEADVISLKRVGPGTPVSYGYEYRTATATTLALVSAGFFRWRPAHRLAGSSDEHQRHRFPSCWPHRDGSVHSRCR